MKKAAIVFIVIAVIITLSVAKTKERSESQELIESEDIQIEATLEEQKETENTSSLQDSEITELIVTDEFNIELNENESVGGF